MALAIGVGEFKTFRKRERSKAPVRLASELDKTPLMIMDPLFKAYGTDRYRERDPDIRLAEERDIPAIAELFRSHYGNGYIAQDVYDGGWVKRSIYRDDTICLVLDHSGLVLATGSVVLNYGDRNDRSGEMGRLAVDPDCSRAGYGTRVIDALFKVAENSLEFASVESRTAHVITQEMVEEARFPHIGFAPMLFSVNGRRESVVLYAKLHGAGEFLRSKRPPYLISEAALLANLVLTGMGLRSELAISDGPFADHRTSSFTVRSMDRSAVAQLLRIPDGRLTDPLLFGNISIEEGFTFVRDKARYLVAYDDDNQPVGTIGLQFDETNRLAKGIELIAENERVWSSLCSAFIHESAALGAEVLSVDVSAYQPGLQRLLFDYGFRPAAYAPAMVFHGTERLDALKMIKLNVPFDPGEMTLTEKSKKMFSLVRSNFV